MERRPGLFAIMIAGFFATLIGIAIAIAIPRALEAQAKREATEASIREWTTKLAEMQGGALKRWDGDTLPESDAWGRSLKVAYERGGLTEKVIVRSAGPDGKYHTSDDLVRGRLIVNFSGVGEGIRENIEATAGNAARGAVRGAMEGAKRGYKELKKKD